MCGGAGDFFSFFFSKKKYFDLGILAISYLSGIKKEGGKGGCMQKKIKLKEFYQSTHRNLALLFPSPIMHTLEETQTVPAFIIIGFVFVLDFLPVLDEILEEILVDCVSLTNTQPPNLLLALSLLGQSVDELKHLHFFMDELGCFRLVGDEPCGSGGVVIRSVGIILGSEYEVNEDIVVVDPLIPYVFANLVDGLALEVEHVQHGFDYWKEWRRGTLMSGDCGWGEWRGRAVFGSCGTLRNIFHRCCGLGFLICGRHFSCWCLI